MAPTRVPPMKRAALPKRLQPRKAPRQGRSRALVAAVLEAGSRILAERGYEGLSMQRVATVAGVSPGSLYQYFPDKPSLVAALIEAQSDRELAFHQARFAELPADASLEQSLVHVVRSIVDFQRSEGALMRRSLEAMAHVGRYPSLAAKAAESAAFLKGLLEAHRSELVVSDLDLATHVVANALHSLTHDGVLPRPPRLDDETLVREATRLAVRYLMAR